LENENIMTTIYTSLKKLFKEWSGVDAQEITRLPRSASNREYFRISGLKHSCIGAYNPDIRENLAFFHFTRHFQNKGLNVPELFLINEKQDCYLQQDLGDTTLYSYLSEMRNNHSFPPKLIETYKKVIAALPKFQILGGQDMDYSLSYPLKNFDRQSMMWDLNYFKHYFLKLTKVPFDEQRLEDDFHKFCNYLLQADCNYFLYRDFQSRNIMLHRDHLYFIDYQGGRRGAIQYDLASLLYDGKAAIPPDVRNLLLDEYIKTAGELTEIDDMEFRKYFSGYSFIRIMQALGCYGFRGFYEKKQHFLLSIPYALINLKYLLENNTIPFDLPTLFPALEQIADSEILSQIGPAQKLQISVNSFSYKNGAPLDISGNGGGFVFDCRALNNPGRYEELKIFTGKDKAVIDFLENKSNAKNFLENVYSLVDNAVENYVERKFTNLMVSFGCTGGMHRSVYCAEKLTEHLSQKYDVIVNLHHIEQENKPVLRS